MDTYQKINEVIRLCSEKKIKCYLSERDSTNYVDKYAPLGERIYDTIKVWIEIGNGRLLKQEVTDLTHLWSRLSKLKNQKDYSGAEKRYNTIIGRGELKVKNYNANEAADALLAFVKTTQQVYEELVRSEGYSNLNAQLISEARELFARININVENLIDGQTKKAAGYLDKIVEQISSFRTNITAKNYINNRALKEAAAAVEQWMTLEHTKEKPCKEMIASTQAVLRRNDKHDEFTQLKSISELKERCANMFSNLDEKYARINSNAVDRLSGISEEMGKVDEEIARTKREIKIKYQNAPEALRESVKMTGFATLRPLEDKKKRLERDLQRGIGKIDDPGITAFNKFYELMNGIREIYNDCAEFEMTYFNMVFNPLLEVSNDGTTPFDVLNSIITSSRITESQYSKIFQWVNITVPVMKNSYYSACEMLSLDNEAYMREFNPEAITESADDLKTRIAESMSFLDEEEAPEQAAPVETGFNYEDLDSFLSEEHHDA